MAVTLTQETLLRLLEIEDFISRDSPERARRFVDQLIARGESLASLSRIGRIVPEIANHDVRELIFRNYRIVYRLKGDAVEILTVFEGHRLLRPSEIEG